MGAGRIERVAPSPSAAPLRRGSVTQHGGDCGTFAMGPAPWRHLPVLATCTLIAGPGLICCPCSVAARSVYAHTTFTLGIGERGAVLMGLGPGPGEDVADAHATVAHKEDAKKRSPRDWNEENCKPSSPKIDSEEQRSRFIFGRLSGLQGRHCRRATSDYTATAACDIDKISSVTTLSHDFLGKSTLLLRCDQKGNGGRALKHGCAGAQHVSHKHRRSVL